MAFNTAMLAVAIGNDFTYETVKHVTVKVRYLQECVQCKIILLAPTCTHQNIADILTKQSAGPQFCMHSLRNYVLGKISISDKIILFVSAMVAYVSRFDTVVNKTAGNTFLPARSVMTLSSCREPAMLDRREFLDRVISMLTQLLNHYVKGHV